MSGRDGAGRLLAAAVRLLPPARRDWGRAMRAELAGLSDRRERWAFAAGCAGVVLRQRAVPRSAAYLLLQAAALTGTVVGSGGVADPVLRWDAVALVAGLVVVAWLGRVAGPLGPVRATRSARTVRGAGFLTVAVAAAGLVAGLDEIGGTQDAEAMVPVLGAILLCYLVGFVAVTADRCAATARTLWTAGAAAAGGALVWSARAVLAPPVPASVGLAVVLLGSAMLIAAYLTRHEPTRGLLAALTAGAGLSLLVLLAVVLLCAYAPARMIPDLAPAALTPADDLAQSRAELPDPYVALLFLGALTALALGVAGLARPAAGRARRGPSRTGHAPGGPG